VRAIGVSNYTVDHLSALLTNDDDDNNKYNIKIKPMVNQVELHPYLTQKKLIKYCEDNQILIQGYSTLGKGALLKDPLAKKLAKKYNRSESQIVLRWSIQRRVPVIPKSASKNRIIDNLKVFDFEISEEDCEKLDKLNKEWHCTWNPNRVT